VKPYHIIFRLDLPRSVHSYTERLEPMEILALSPHPNDIQVLSIHFISQQATTCVAFHPRLKRVKFQGKTARLS
jgi:hypothetical protein